MAALVRVAHGIHRPAEQVADEVGTVSAVLRALPEDAVVAGLTAARLHGLWLPPGLSGPIETISHWGNPVATARSRSRRGELRARRQMLRADEVTVVAGIAMTSESRTWLDLAGRLGMADLVALGDSTLRGTATIERLAELVGRAARRPGVIAARAALPLLDRRSRSRPESHLRYIVRSAAGLPAPEVNVAIHTEAGEWLAEPDLSYGDVRLALEYNGADHAEVRRLRGDITREIDVEERGGWRVATFGPVQVFQRPDQVVNRVRRLRRECGARPSG